LALRVGYRGPCLDVRAEQKLLDAFGWIVDSRMARIKDKERLSGLSLCSEQPTQNWSGQGESDCLIKTKHCDGLKRC
jgi:hypothetical protein